MKYIERCYNTLLVMDIAWALKLLLLPALNVKGFRVFINVKLPRFSFRYVFNS